MTHHDTLKKVLESLPPKYIPLIAADFAEAVLPIYEAYNKDSSVIIEAIAAARSGDKARAEAANVMYNAIPHYYVTNPASSANAGYAAICAANTAAASTHTTLVNAAVNGVYAACDAPKSAKDRKAMKKRQIEIVKGWIAKIKAEEPVLMAFYDIEDDFF